MDRDQYIFCYVSHSAVVDPVERHIWWSETDPFSSRIVGSVLCMLRAACHEPVTIVCAPCRQVLSRKSVTSTEDADVDAEHEALHMHGICKKVSEKLHTLTFQCLSFFFPVHKPNP